MTIVIGADHSRGFIQYKMFQSVDFSSAVDEDLQRDEDLQIEASCD